MFSIPCGLGMRLVTGMHTRGQEHINKFSPAEKAGKFIYICVLDGVYSPLSPLDNITVRKQPKQLACHNIKDFPEREREGKKKNRTVGYAREPFYEIAMGSKKR